jgi:predicted transglutaminase-like cysteine proteinase
MKNKLPLLFCVFLCACSTVPQGHAVKENHWKFDKVESTYEKSDKTDWYKFIKDSKTIEEINNKINTVEYKTENVDNWKSPTNFIKNGGDCEDYSLAKYHALKDIGYSENSLKISIVRDSVFRYHAILLVNDSLVLDNQEKQIKKLSETDYILVYSVNKNGVYSYEK